MSPQASPPRVLVLENEPFWLPELQRQFQAEPVTIEAIAVDEVAMKDDSVVVAVAEILLQQGAREFFAAQPGAVGTPLVAIAGRSVQRWEWLLRELGAVSVIDQFTRGEQLAMLCRRLLDRSHPPLPL